MISTRDGTRQEHTNLDINPNKEKKAQEISHSNSPKMINTHNCLQCLNSCWFYQSACLLVFRCFPGSCRFHCSRNPPRFAGSPYELCDIPRLCFKIHAFCWLNHSNPLICWLNFYFRCRNPTSSWSVWRTWSEVEGLRVLDRWETNTAARRGTHRI